MLDVFQFFMNLTSGKGGFLMLTQETACLKLEAPWCLKFDFMLQITFYWER